MTTTTPEKPNVSSAGDKIVKSPWHESIPDRPNKSVKDTWKEQFALISALSQDPPAEEKFEEGTTDPTPNNKQLLERVDEMEKDGSLSHALDHLAAAHDASKKIDPSIIVQVAQLLCIMDESVYMRDLQVEKKVREDMFKYGNSIDTAMKKNEKLGDDAKTAIHQALTDMDEITKSINEVAVAMGLEYVPLCNFSSWGKILSNGPYCGAFYRKPQKGDNGIIVVAFKGTGRFEEWFTDARVIQISASKSPVRGSVHEGFFNGIFSEFPSEISADERVGKTTPFDLLKKQLWRLTSQTMANTEDKQVPVWVTGHSLGGAYATHCWQGLLATARLNPYDKSRSIRDLFTFGSPRVGNKTYARYPNTIKAFQNSWRFVNKGDIVAQVPYFSYQHVDRKVVISPDRIELRKNKNKEDPPPEGISDTIGHLLGFSQHGLGSYWTSLREGAKKMKSGSWPESQREVIPPIYPNLATWSLEQYHPPKEVPSESHADSKPNEESVLVGEDRRHSAELPDFKDGAKWRSVVKIQSMFRLKHRPEPVWTMGTGWLIREDLVVTAGHNVYSNTYEGQAEQIKCWIGYKGRDFVNEKSVQHRKALNVVTTASWCNGDGDRRRDVAFIQVSSPFEGNLKPFRFMDTGMKVTNERITIVGYPGDKSIIDKHGIKDPGAQMCFDTESISYDLDESGMIKYDIDTFGGQSGAPILQLVGDDLVGIGTHCYGAGGSTYLNSGNAIGGANGNNYEQLMKCFDGSEPENPTPIGTFIPNKSGDHESNPDDGESFPDGEEGFWDVFKTVAKIGSVALPSAGAFLGPAGALLGTVAGGVLGSLAESQIESGAPKTPQEYIQDRCIQRAQLAEAALQSVIRLGHSSQSSKVFTTMEKKWGESYSKQIPALVDFIGPALTEYGFFITTNNWAKEVEPNPEKRKLLEGKDNEFTVPPSEGYEDNKKANLVRALFKGQTRRVDGIPGNEESFTSWFKPLIEKAILAAKPIATDAAKKAFHAILDKITKSSGESFSSEDKQTKMFENVIRRALMADCALQAIEELSENELKALKLSPTDAGHEEGIIDSIKTRVQKIGPVALDFAKSTVIKYIPVLLKQLEKKLNPTSESDVDLRSLMSADLTSSRSADLASLKSAGLFTSLNSRVIPMSALPPNGTVGRFIKDDDNPDKPPIEPRPPAEPRPAPPKE